MVVVHQTNPEQQQENPDERTTELVFYIIDGCLAIVFLLCALFYVILFITKRSSLTKRFLMENSVPSMSIIMLVFCLVKSIHVVCPIFELLDNKIATFVLTVVQFVTLYITTFLLFSISLISLYYGIKQYTVNGSVISQRGLFFYKILFTILITFNAILLIGSFGFSIGEHTWRTFFKEEEQQSLADVAFYVFIGCYSYQFLVQACVGLYGIAFHVFNGKYILLDDYIARKCTRSFLGSCVGVSFSMVIFMATILTVHTLDFQNVLRESLPFFTLAGDSVLAFLTVCLVLVWGPLNPSLSSLYASMQGAMERRSLIDEHSKSSLGSSSSSTLNHARSSVNRM
ncbi:hypothetical protein FDP41_005278 [Naegleria fowleri]|uniref:Uncharacterized protein n=1 Tax=Naegleria fowleri TaxID=5763 RepID=A0A6A5BNV4_NAEFO|nr:uncharacterized protein FDP41_005278 [Naegleria fowleri]KAF0975951.1 hypothetical protein FDP41_005278 [Naegleria fowleri]